MSAGLNLMYQNILGRTPSQEELQGWQSTGLTGQALYDAFNTAASQEQQARRAAAPAPMGNASQMINANYATLVGRDPTEAERTSWMGSGLTGEALYNAMAQAAQAEQQATGFTPTMPTGLTREQAPGITDFINMPMNQGGLGGLGGTDTGGTDTGGTGDAGGTDTGTDTGAATTNNQNFMDMFNQLAQQQLQAQMAQQQAYQQMMQQQMGGFQDMFNNFSQQNMLFNERDAFGGQQGNPNAPTFGPGSGGNFGGQISPVYRPTQNGTDAQPRNGWGGPWQSNNPFAPTF